MLKGDELVGTIAIFRQHVQLFTEKQIELVQNFAAQAVIAIENARLLKELRQRTDDLAELLERQTATSDVLQIISSVPGDLERVFQTMLEKAVRICDAKFGVLYLTEGEGFRAAAMHNAPPAYEEARAGILHPPPSSSLWRAANTKQAAQIADVMLERGYAEGDPFVVSAVALGGYRSVFSVPMLHEDKLIGVITIFRQEVRPFNDKEIALVQNFAAQAVIAIENARLLNELRQSLEQQTATAEVLKVVSSSPGDLQPVFASMLENATRLCEASFGVMLLHEEGSLFRAVAMYNMPPAYAQVRLKEPVARPSPLTPQGRVAATKRLLHIPDVAVDVAYKEGDPLFLWFIEATGARSLVLVPMLKDDELLGVISIYRREVRPFTDKQIALVENFAAQAVIAIENARLLNELRQRTTDLTEALEQQTATSDVLRVVSSSPSDLEPVFASMLEKAVRICDAKFGNIYRWDGEILSAVASHHTPSAFVAARQRTALRPGPKNPLREMVATKKAVNILDMAATASYAEGEPVTVAAVELGGVRTLLAVPMLKENELIGAFLLARGEIHPFTDKQVALVTSFAAQAVIAIENTRLLNELRQRTADLAELLEQQTATANVLEVISRSAFDLHAVFETVAESSVKLCEADRGVILRFDGELLRMVATYNTSPGFEDWVAQPPIRPGRHSASARAALERRTIHIPDVRADGEYTYGAKSFEETRTILGVPILKGDNLLGVMIIYHVEEVRPFTDKQIALVETFADQAAIAIENVRLLDALRQRTDDLSASLDDLRTAQDRLVQTEKLASLGQLTAGIAHEIKNPLNFVNNFSAVSVELIDELREAFGGIHLDTKQRAEISEIADMLQGNLDKVVQHGKRADSIVKNMLLHSRQGSGEHRPVDINALVDESLNLAYHGARAEKQGFNITLERSFDPAAGEVDLFPQDITRVLLNLISNGFYAATKRQAESRWGRFRAYACRRDQGPRRQS